MRIVLLGGSGFIGHHAARWLSGEGHAVTVVHRGRTMVALPGVDSLHAVRGEPRSLGTALHAARPETLVDFIGYTDRDVESLCAALPDSLTRLVLISSGDVYWTYDAFHGHRAVPTATPLPLTEDAPLRAQLFPYRAQASGPEDLRFGYEKILVERLTRERSPVPVTVLRLPMVYGAHDPNRRVQTWLDRLNARPVRLGVNPDEAGWRCTRGYVEDVAWAVAVAATHPRAMGATFNVGEAEAPGELEWLREIARAAGWEGEVSADPAVPPSVPAHWEVPLVTDTSRIRNRLDYREPVGRAEGIRRTVDSALRPRATGVA